MKLNRVNLIRTRVSISFIIIEHLNPTSSEPFYKRELIGLIKKFKLYFKLHFQFKKLFFIWFLGVDQLSHGMAILTSHKMFWSKRFLLQMNNQLLNHTLDTRKEPKVLQVWYDLMIIWPLTSRYGLALTLHYILSTNEYIPTS